MDKTDFILLLIFAIGTGGFLYFLHENNQYKKRYFQKTTEAIKKRIDETDLTKTQISKN